MRNKQIRKYPASLRVALGVLLLSVLMSTGLVASARVEQEFYPTRHAAELAARQMGGRTSIVYDKDMGEYMVTMVDKPRISRTHRHRLIHPRHH